MNSLSPSLLITLIVVHLSSGIELHRIDIDDEQSTPPPPPKPYAFGYAAGRYPGHIDRTHSEVSDGSGVVQGSYSYVDPRHRIRTVEYIADKEGFHPILNENTPDLPADTPVVAAAKQKHLERFAAIAQSRQASPGQVVVPKDTKTVEYAKQKHLALYQQIAAQHAREAEELERLKKAYGGNEVEQEHY